MDGSYDPSNVSATPSSSDPRVLCGPCHGDAPGTAPWHRNAGLGSISVTEVDLRIRSISNLSWGTGARYNGSGGGSVDLSGYTSGTSTNKAGGGNGLKECSNLDCHGRPNPTRDAIVGGSQSQSNENDRAHMPESLLWTDTYVRTTHGPSGKYQVTMRTMVPPR